MRRSNTSGSGRTRKRRDRATEEDRMVELARAQERRLANSRASHVVDCVKDHVSSLSSVKRRVLDESRRKLSSAFAEQVCSVCDCLHPASSIIALNVQQYQKLLPAMSARLKAPPNLQDGLLSHYSIAELIPEMAGLLLSRSGVVVNNGRSVLQVCKACNTSLLSKRRSHPPKFAIANGLFIGHLPSSFTDTTPTENAMINLSQPMHYLSVVRGGRHASLRSHAYYFRADPAPPAMLLPRDVVSSGVIGVTMVGAMTTAQKAAMCKKYDARVPRLRALLDWYKENNRLYRDIQEHSEWEATGMTMPTRVVVDATEGAGTAAATGNAHEDGHLLEGLRELDESTWRHNAPHPAHLAVCDSDEVCEQTATGLISDFSQVDPTVGVQLALKKKGVVVHRSSGLLSDFDPAFLVHAFCDLFPYGRGGLDEPRGVPISAQEFVRYCLRLASRQFAQHPSFSLVAFDVLARHNALQAIYIKAKMTPRVVANAATVPREVLHEYVEYQQERLRALSQMEQCHEPPLLDDRLKDLYASISAGMRAFWGSNDERVDNRKEVFALQLHHGQPSIFLTISPDCSSSFQIGILAGAIPTSTMEGIQSAVNDCLTFTRARLGHIATSNPYICAKYFDIVMTTFIEVVLGWDSDNGCPGTEPGLFGHTRAFYSSTESQSSTGSLHAHMLIWIEGVPSTVKEYYNMCSIERFRTIMVSYVDGLVSSNAPLDTRTCLTCGSTDLEPTALKQEAFKKARSGAQRPETLKCRACGASYGADEAIAGHAARVEAIANNSGGTDDNVFRDVAGCSFLPCDPEPNSPDAARVARALLYYQHHHWNHAKSCFKVTKRTPKGNVCRMFMPKERCVQTRWTTDNTIELRRAPGNEYINTYSPVVNPVFKCNHDVKFLAAGEGPEKAYYMMKYATKPQQDLENPWALHLHAFDKAQDRAGDDHEDALAAGRRVAQSMCCSLSSPHEVAAPMACLYLIRGSAVYSSHKFVKLHMSSVLTAIFNQDEDVEVLLEDDERQFTPQSVWQDYMLRPVELESLDLMKFVSNWERKKGSKGIKFCRTHPLCGTHSLHRRAEERVVVLIQKRLPDVRRDDLTDAERLRYQQSMMVLFRPFRTPRDFIAPDEAFEDAFHRWWHRSASHTARSFAENNADYYSSRELSNQRCDPDITRYRSYEGNVDRNDDVCDEESDSDSESIADDDEGYTDETTVLPLDPSKYVGVIDKARQVAELAAVSSIESEDTIPAIQMRIDDVEQCLREIESSSTNDSVADASVVVGGSFPDFPTRVRLLERATSDVSLYSAPDQESTPIGEPLNLLPDQPTIREVSTALKLNMKQHQMFAAAAEKLITSILMGHDTTTQMVAFLGGLPGAGKSRVIAALQCLALKWNAQQTVATAAYQGVAAQAADGQTIHKLFGWFVNSKREWVPTRAQRERFAQLKLLILDEISTCDVKILGMVDRSLRKLLDRPSCVFGGVHVLLVGDWLQQLPVAGQPAYQPPTAIIYPANRKKKAQDDYLLRLRGANAYNAVNTVVILEENMRHRGDPTWMNILEKWRWGHYDASDLELVNKVAHEENWTSLNASMKAYCPIIVTSNALRVEFNSIALRAFCAAKDTVLHQFPARITRTRQPLSPAQERSLRHIRDDKTKGMSTLLELSIGSTAQCTKNVSPSLKLANGTIGLVLGFIPAGDDTVQVTVVDGVVTHTHSQPPEVVFLKLKDFANRSFSSQLPIGVVPVTKRVERGISIKMEKRSFSVTIHQVPLVPAFSLTTEKCQGLTVDKMVLAPLRHQTRRNPQKSSLYVAVTRVKSIRQLYMMAPLTETYVSYFKPAQDAIAETRRLQAKES